ncbi:MAG TPA: type III pantothenate kinase [Erysipelothrix sp.]
MKLFVNVGNTTIWFVYWENEIKHSFKLKHKDFLKDHLEKINLPIEGIYIASVVADMGLLVADKLEAFFNMKPHIIQKEEITKVYENEYPFAQLGIDRLLVAQGAVKKYNRPLIVCDLGTASTLNYINEYGEFEGGLIMPGMDMSLTNLYQNTSKLPKVEKVGAVQFLGKNTEENIRSGIYYSLIFTIEAYARQLNVPVILTGGNSEHLLPYFKIPVNHEPTLLIEGMADIYA